MRLHRRMSSLPIKGPGVRQVMIMLLTFCCGTLEVSSNDH